MLSLQQAPVTFQGQSPVAFQGPQAPVTFQGGQGLQGTTDWFKWTAWAGMFLALGFGAGYVYGSRWGMKFAIEHSRAVRSGG